MGGSFFNEREIVAEITNNNGVIQKIIAKTLLENSITSADRFHVGLGNGKIFTTTTTSTTTSQTTPSTTDSTTAIPTTETADSTTAIPTTETADSTTAIPTTETADSTTADTTTQTPDSTTADTTTQTPDSTTADTTQTPNSTTANPTTQTTDSTTAVPTTQTTESTTTFTTCAPLTCDPNAVEISSVPCGSCQCNAGFVGPGEFCGVDSDNDGWSDVNLNCSDPSCTQDNCVDVTNSGQEDADNDNVGDMCDNCPNVANPGQEDNYGNGVGDACENDCDGDGVEDEDDICPCNNYINNTDFRGVKNLTLGKNSYGQDPPVWEFKDDGKEIIQKINSAPGIAIGKESFSGVEYEGTVFIGDPYDDDWVGVIFSYQVS